MRVNTVRGCGALLWAVAWSACAPDETAIEVQETDAPHSAGTGPNVAGATADAGLPQDDGTPCISGDRDHDGVQDCDDRCPDDPRKLLPEACGCGVPEATCSANTPPGAPIGTAPTSPSTTAPTPIGSPSTQTSTAGTVDAGPSTMEASTAPLSCSVAPIPEALRQAYMLQPFYTRYADAKGVPIIASDAPSDEAMRRACMLVEDLIGVHDDVRQQLLTQKIRFAMMGRSEKTVDLPDFAYLGDIDWRARGLGGMPTAVCAEESILCDRMADRWRGESICVHEFAHTMQMAGYSLADKMFDGRLRNAYNAAIAAGLFANTYAASDDAEYFAEGVQDWYNTNQEVPRADGVHNHVNTRAELRSYDPMLYAILARVLPDKPAYRDCYNYE